MGGKQPHDARGLPIQERDLEAQRAAAKRGLSQTKILEQSHGKPQAHVYDDHLDVTLPAIKAGRGQAGASQTELHTLSALQSSMLSGTGPAKLVH